MFHTERPLLLADLQESNGLNFDYTIKGNNIHRATSMHHIAMAIAAAYPKEIGQIFGKAKAQPWSSIATFPQLPSIDRLGPYRTNAATLELIMENEGTIEGVHNILENIFGKQLCKDKALDFEEELYLVYGDQATVKNIQGTKRECSTDEDAYERKNWLMPVPGLWHVRLHFVDAIKDCFWGPDDRWKASMLKTHSVVLNRKQTPVYEIPFSFMESLVRDSAYARIMGFVYAVLEDGLGEAEVGRKDSCTSFENRPDIADRIRHWNPQRFYAVVRKVFDSAFAPDKQVSPPDALGGVPLTTLQEEKNAKRRENKNKRQRKQTGTSTQSPPTSPSTSQQTGGAGKTYQSTCQSTRYPTNTSTAGPSISHLPADVQSSTQASASQDSGQTSSSQAQCRPVKPVEIGTGTEEVTNHIRYLFWTSTYLTLVAGIKHGDVGLVRWVMDRAILLFQARTKVNYASISKWIKLVTDSSAAEPELREAVIANMLVNTTGRADGWFEADRLIELLNLSMRNAVKDKATGSFDVEKQMKGVSLWANTYGGLRDAVEWQYGNKTNNRHYQRDVSQDIHNLAYKLMLTSVRPKPGGLPMPWRSPDLVAEGMRKLVDGGLARFNASVVHRYGQFDRYRMFRSGRHEGEAADIDDDASLKPDRVYEERHGLGAFSAEDLGDALSFEGLGLGGSSSLYETN